MEKYKFLPHTADTMFEAYGENVEELFTNSALAVETIMVDTKTVKKTEHYEITLETNSLEDLFYDFLSELIFVKDTEGLLFSKFDVVIHCKNKKYELFVKCEGEHIDREKHKLLDDAKAITLHDFILEQKEDNSWFAKVIVDI